MDIFGTTGASRRAWLDGVDQKIGDGLRYFLGPSGLDQRVNALATVAPMLMDGTDYMDAATASRNLLANPSIPNALAFATPMVALAMPGVSARMAEGVADLGGDVARFARSEDGGLRLYHGTTRENYDSIIDGGFLGPSYFSPSRGVAEDFAVNVGGSADDVVSVDVPRHAAMVDLDLPSGQLLSPEDAAAYLGDPSLKDIDDFYRKGYSIGVTDPSVITLVQKFGIAGVAAMFGMSQVDFDAMLSGQDRPVNSLSGL